MDKEDFEVSKEIQYWAGRLIDHDQAYDIAEEIVEAIKHSEQLQSQSEAVDTDREKDINQLCKAVLELAPRNIGDSGTGAECPFCFEEGNWDGDISDMKHDLDCAYLIAKDLSTNSNNGH